MIQKQLYAPEPSRRRRNQSIFLPRRPIIIHPPQDLHSLEKQNVFMLTNSVYLSPYGLLYTCNANLDNKSQFFERVGAPHLITL